MNKKQKATIGKWIMATGFLAGSYVCVAQAKGLNATLYAVAFVVTLVGTVMTRLGQGIDSDDREQVDKGIDTISRSLGLLVEKVQCMNRDRESIDIFAFSQRIDDDCIEAINDFVEARETIIPRFGMPRYAEVMDNFSRGERALNRAWCAAADGYIDELFACLDKAEGAMTRARDLLDEATPPS